MPGDEPLRLPANVKIGAVRYGIHEFEPEMADGAGAWGSFDPARAKILLDTRRPPAIIAETLVHELMHGLIHDAALDFEDDDEEALVKRLSPRLAALISDNPLVVRWISEHL
jgi:hypothetical protein